MNVAEHQQDDIDDAVLAFLTAHHPGLVVERDHDLFRQGGMNSLFAIQLMNFLESHFDLVLDVEDLDLRNFSTLNRINAFVQRKQGIGAEPLERP
jgi:acyl carrier protein